MIIAIHHDDGDDDDGDDDDNGYDIEHDDNHGS